MNRFLRSVTALLLVSGFSARGDVEFLWGVTGVGGAPSTLYAINPGNGQVLGSIGATGRVCLSGLAVQPGSGTLLAAQGQMSPTGASAKAFFRIDKATGAATAIGAPLANTMAISDIAMQSNGALFGFGIGASVKKLVSINPSTGAVTTIGNTNNITNVSLTFGANNVLYLVRTNALFTVNTGTGATTLVAALTGATTQISNLMATNAAGAIYGGYRTGGGTRLYRINPATAVTSAGAMVGGIALCGIAFDRAAPPVVAVTGKTKIKTTKSKLSLKGTATSLLPLTVATKGAQVTVAQGKWTLKVKLKKGTNRLTLICADGMGQSSAVKVTVKRQ